MATIKRYIHAFLRDERGVTAVEYAIAGGLIAVGGIFAFGNLGSEVVRVTGLIFTTLSNVVI